jgi:hypothetical protein
LTSPHSQASAAVVRRPRETIAPRAKDLNTTTSWAPWRTSKSVSRSASAAHRVRLSIEESRSASPLMTVIVPVLRRIFNDAPEPPTVNTPTRSRARHGTAQYQRDLGRVSTSGPCGPGQFPSRLMGDCRAIHSLSAMRARQMAPPIIWVAPALSPQQNRRSKAIKCTQPYPSRTSKPWLKARR